MNKTVLITGGTGGIGLGIAKAFANAGYQLVLNGLEKEGRHLADTLRQEFGVRIFFSDANLLDVAAIEQFIAAAQQQMGGIDVLINNAGIQHVSPIEKFPVQRWNDIIGLNLSAAFHTTRLCLGAMKTNHWGRIINIVSAHGLVASEFKAAYVAAKHGLIGLTKVTALEGAVFGVTANAICPGYADTELVRSQVADQALSFNLSEEEVISKIMLAKHAVKKFVTPESIGAFCVFLASEPASLITGTALPIDGGWTAQ